MTGFQKTVCILLSLCFFAVLVWMPESFFLEGNVYRQIPLYCFLESEAERELYDSDRETTEQIIAANGAYLMEQVQKEQAQLKQQQRREEELLSENMEYTGEEKEDSKAEEERETEEERVIGEGRAIEEERITEEGREIEEERITEEGRAIEEERSAQEGREIEEERITEEGRAIEEERLAQEGSETEKEWAAEEQSEPVETIPAPTLSDENTQSEETPEYFLEEEDTAAAEASSVPHPVIDLSPERLQDYDYLRNQFFIIDANANVSDGLLNAAEFLGEDLTMKQDASAPQILIYHTHSQETFADSREGKTEDTVVGVGDYLTEILTEKYGYHVIHVAEAFDLMGGTLDRNSAYDYAREYLERYLQENPSVEVLIDLHRDGVSENRHLVTEINGKPTAQIMFYNGLSNTVSQGNVDYLPNPYIKDNLAFSFQLEYQAAEYYPDFYRGIYLAGLRYNLHLRPKSLLLEAGAQTNTLQEVKNAMEPFADILHRVLKGSDNGR